MNPFKSLSELLGRCGFRCSEETTRRMVESGVLGRSVVDQIKDEAAKGEARVLINDCLVRLRAKTA